MHIRPFEIALIGIFAVAAIVGIFFISNYDGGDSPEAELYGDSVLIWGTLDQNTMNNFISDLSVTNKALEVVKYVQIDARYFDTKFVDAIAEGRSPDLVILPHTQLVTYRSKLQPISLEVLSERTFRDTYIDGTEIFMRNDGTYGIPFAVDPLVMYWNKDIFSSSGLASPPKTWEALINQTIPTIVRKDDDLAITQSAIAFGEYANIEHAKDIIAMLLMQAGSSVVEEHGDAYSVTLNQNIENGLSSGEAAFTFYTQFVNPNHELYSWNRSKRLDRTEFLSGSLALYFGKGSEGQRIERENTNLNYDIAPVPQDGVATIRRDYGDFYAFAIPRATHNMQGAYAIATLFGSLENAGQLSDVYNFAPVHRALFTGSVGDPTKDIIYQSALISHGWLDPSPKKSDDIFRTAVEEATSGKGRINSVVRDAVYGLESLF